MKTRYTPLIIALSCSLFPAAAQVTADACKGLIVYADADGDSYGDLSVSYFAADCIVPGGYVLDSTDCNDLNASIHPNASAFCNNHIDDNCNGVIDENCGEACGLPIGLTTSNIAGASSKMNWDAVADAHKYKLRYKITGSSSWTTISDISSASKTISGLLSNTSYIWQVKNDCAANPGVASGWSSKQTFTTLSALIREELLQRVSFSIYPNPAEDQATIQFSIGVRSNAFLPYSDPYAQASHVYIIVYDLNGKEIVMLLNAEVEQGDYTLQLNTNHFSKGVYVVKMISDFGIENIRLIVQ